MKYAIAIALLGVTSVSAAPYYVGENIQPKNNITLGFTDTPTKELANGSGNIAAFELKGAYAPADKTSLRVGLPFYMASKEVTTTGTSSKNALGNAWVGAAWAEKLTSANQAYTYGYGISADAYLPTSRKTEGTTVGNYNPTTDLYKYYTKATAFTPTVGAFISQERWSAKTNVGGVYAYVPKTATSRDANRLNVTWQTAATWNALSNLQANLEYNTIFLDSATRESAGTTRGRLRHAITPSVSGNYEKLLASLYATLPLDSATRDTTNVAIGVNAGYTF